VRGAAHQIAVVASARKLAVLCWHLVVKGEDYAYQRPSLTAQKLRALERQAGLPSHRRRRGSSPNTLKEVQARERALSEQAERAYRQLVADWHARSPRPKAGAGAATGERL
jgi:transposase